MEIMLGNALTAIADSIAVEEKLSKSPTILGMRVIDGPWENTKFLDVETVDKQYSALLVKKNGVLVKIAPFKVTKKDNGLKK